MAVRNAGKRGGEVYKEGRVEQYDAKDKEAILSAKGLRNTYDGERYQFLNVDIALSEGQKVAIVGPNGSGKSNVIDALLFVFGKRAKQIRLNKVGRARRCTRAMVATSLP